MTSTSDFSTGVATGGGSITSVSIFLRLDLVLEVG